MTTAIYAYSTTLFPTTPIETMLYTGNWINANGVQVRWQSTDSAVRSILSPGLIPSIATTTTSPPPSLAFPSTASRFSSFATPTTATPSLPISSNSLSNASRLTTYSTANRASPSSISHVTMTPSQKTPLSSTTRGTVETTSSRTSLSKDMKIEIGVLVSFASLIFALLVLVTIRRWWLQVAHGPNSHPKIPTASHPYGISDIPASMINPRSAQHAMLNAVEIGDSRPVSDDTPTNNHSVPPGRQLQA